MLFRFWFFSHKLIITTKIKARLIKRRAVWLRKPGCLGEHQFRVKLFVELLDECGHHLRKGHAVHLDFFVVIEPDACRGVSEFFGDDLGKGQVIDLNDLLEHEHALVDFVQSTGDHTVRGAADVSGREIVQFATSTRRTDAVDVLQSLLLLSQGTPPCASVDARLFYTKSNKFEITVTRGLPVRYNIRK